MPGGIIPGQTALVEEDAEISHALSYGPTRRGNTGKSWLANCHNAQDNPWVTPFRAKADDRDFETASAGLALIMFESNRLPRYAGVIAILLGSWTLGGWIFGINLLKTVLPGLISMKANTAVCLIFAGSSLLLQLERPDRPRWHLFVARLLAGLAFAASLLTLIEYVFELDLGVDRLLFEEGVRHAGGSFPGRMSFSTGLDFVFLGAALLSLDWQVKGSDRFPAQYFAFAAAAVTSLAFVGYFYGVESLSRLQAYSAIALNTVIASWILCVGILLARPQRGVMALFMSDKLGGLVARRMLPAAILLPLLGGWLGVLGQRAGYYGVGFGSALYATALMVIFAVLVLWAANALDRTDTERQQGAEALRRSNARLQAVREEERTRLAREIHDVLAQELTRLKLEISWLKRQLAHPADPDQHDKTLQKLAGMTELTDLAIASVQKIATELRPVVLDSLGLCAAIEWQGRDFETRTAIQCRAVVPGLDPELGRDQATALFRILQEALTNVARHAEATQVQIELCSRDNWLVLAVRDNGRGIAPSELADPRSVGLLGMRERATLLGGTCEISLRPEGGTAIEARLPIAKPAEPAEALGR